MHINSIKGRENAMTEIAKLPEDCNEELLADPAVQRDRGIGEILSQLTEHESADAHLSIVLDWASEIRTRYSLNWDDALCYAMLAYLG